MNPPIVIIGGGKFVRDALGVIHYLRDKGTEYHILENVMPDRSVI